MIIERTSSFIDKKVDLARKIKDVKPETIIDFAKARAELAKEKAKADFTDPLLMKFADIIKPLLPSALENCVAANVNFPNNFKEELTRIKEENRTIIVPINHRSIWDGAVVAVNIASALKENLGQDAKIVMPVTGAFATGDQGSFLYAMSGIMADQIRPYGVDELWPILRRKDKEKGVKQTREHRRNALNVLKVAVNNTHMIIAPCGTVDSGRFIDKFQPWKGKKGMQAPESDIPILGRIVAEAIEHDKKVAFLPVTIVGTENIFSPNWNVPPLKAIYSAKTHQNLEIVQVKTGVFVTGEEIWQLAEQRCRMRMEKDSDSMGNTIVVPSLAIQNEVNMLLMGMIAQKLPENERGYYKNVFTRNSR